MEANKKIYRPRTLKEAKKMLSANDNLRPLAGGTLIFPWQRQKFYKFEQLLDLSLLIDLKKIKKMEDNSYFLGAMLRLDQLAEDKFLKNLWPLLSLAAQKIASPQIRSQATLGGNLASGHPAADLVPPLLVLGAEILIDSAQGERRLGLASYLGHQSATVHPCPPFGCGGEKDEFCPPPVNILPFTGLPAQTKMPPNHLEPGELIKGIILPQRNDAESELYILHVREALRPVFDFPLISFSLSAQKEKSVLKNICLALNGIAASSFLIIYPMLDLQDLSAKEQFLETVRTEIISKNLKRPCQKFRQKVLENALMKELNY